MSWAVPTAPELSPKSNQGYVRDRAKHQLKYSAAECCLDHLFELYIQLQLGGLCQRLDQTTLCHPHHQHLQQFVWLLFQLLT